VSSSDRMSARLTLMSDEAFSAFYDIVLAEKKRREVASIDTMPAPSNKVELLLSKLDFFYAYEVYAEENGCSLTLAKMVIDRRRGGKN